MSLLMRSLLKIAGHLSKALDCAGKQDALTIELNTARKDVAEKVRNDYAKVLKEFPEYGR